MTLNKYRQYENEFLKLIHVGDYESASQLLHNIMSMFINDLMDEVYVHKNKDTIIKIARRIDNLNKIPMIDE